MRQKVEPSDVMNSARDAAVAYFKLHQLHLAGKSLGPLTLHGALKDQTPVKFRICLMHTVLDSYGYINYWPNYKFYVKIFVDIVFIYT